MPEYQKLVRDFIPDIIEANGETPVFRIAGDNEITGMLATKLGEEATEVIENPCLEELADSLEVIYALAKVLGHTREELEAMRLQKAQKRGGFDARIFLERTI
jgi:predicted house-cleaning noncanonical NTP pyrophosphatase (MazG superfamily)